MSITFPNDTIDIIDAIRGAIGRPVSFFSATVTACVASGCSLDPVSNTSTNSFCPVCNGVYWIPTYSPTTVTGHITWGNADELNWQTAGHLFDGDCRIQIKLRDNTLAMLDSTVYVVADGKTLEIKSKILRGVPQLNRVLLDLIEKEK